MLFSVLVVVTLITNIIIIEHLLQPEENWEHAHDASISCYFSSKGELGPLPSCWGLTKSDLKSTQVYINQLPLGTGWGAYN